MNEKQETTYAEVLRTPCRVNNKQNHNYATIVKFIKPTYYEKILNIQRKKKEILPTED